MSNEAIPAEFWNRVDKAVDLANEQVKEASIGEVSSSMLYAAARFNAFNVAVTAQSAEAMKKEKEAAIQYFTEHFKKMLSDNLEDYIQNYQSYRPDA